MHKRYAKMYFKIILLCRDGVPGSHVVLLLSDKINYDQWYKGLNYLRVWAHLMNEINFCSHI